MARLAGVMMGPYPHPQQGVAESIVFDPFRCDRCGDWIRNRWELLKHHYRHAREIFDVS